MMRLFKQRKRSKVGFHVSPNLESEKLDQISTGVNQNGLVLAYPDFNHLLHALRTTELRRMPYRPSTMISVGCAGSWYFDWIHQSFYNPRKHVGVEFFSPKPDLLPANVEWIQNTASDMSQLKQQEADLLFSGQNLEHLLPGEILHFFLECHRVIKPGGMLILDSPNRTQTSKLQWNQPEHFIEFTSAEIAEVLVAAGFSKPKLKGIWLCEDPRTGSLLPLDRFQSDDLLWRVLAATDDPDHSFIWWAESERLDVAPDCDRLDGLIRRIVEEAWPDRLSRLLTQIGTPLDDESGRWFVAEAGVAGPLLYGPYVPLEQGSYSVTFVLRVSEMDRSRQDIASIDVVSASADTVLVLENLTTSAVDSAGMVQRTLQFTLEKTTFAVEFRVITTGAAKVCALRDVRLRRQEGTFRPTPSPS